jgi:hypothetical protein
MTGPPADTRIRLARMHAQGLAGRRATDVADAVRRVVGLQAQDVRANRLAVRVRTDGRTESDVDVAVNEKRAVVRTWAMRGTLHLLAAEDLGWIVGLLGPYFAARMAGRRRQLGLDEATCERGVAALHAELSNTRPLSRAELVSRIADHGVVLDPRGQAPAHLLGYAAMIGGLCRGPDTGAGEPTYTLAADWIGRQPPVAPGEALARLATRYLAGYGPATAGDFAAWSGLALGRARAAFDAIAAELEPAGAAGFVLAAAPPPPAAGPGRPQLRLLGHFDTYLLGYRGRALAVPPEFDRRIQAGGGFIMPAVLVDGRVLGTWRQRRTRAGLEVSIAPFTTLPKRLLPALRAEVSDLGRFLGIDATLAPPA